MSRFPAACRSLLLPFVMLTMACSCPAPPETGAPAGADVKATVGRDGAAPGVAGGGALSEPVTPAPMPPKPGDKDIHSFSRPDETRVTHLDLDWTVSFQERALDGSATLLLKRVVPGRPLTLDTRALDVRAVEAGTAKGLTPAQWAWGETDTILGRALVVTLPDNADRVKITYRTSPDASGLQWLDPAQTAGVLHPFLYTQSQAIHARSWIPCQDSPGVRATFTARVRVPAPLRAVMAAEFLKPRADEKEVWRFQMEQPVPSYLLALAAGDLKEKSIGRRTAVWAEPAVLDKAAYEFADMEKMLEAAEALYGEYRWGRYDLLVLPPSFPFGGMENPRLTFATPTVLAGDRSLVALVAHELAHSWSGNLVTNATWSDFWLNEGFTTYFERRLIEAVYGRDRAEMEGMIGRRELEEEIVRLADKPGDQVLHQNLEGRDPDDAVNNIPYEKGALFARRLEEAYGRTAFDAFLRAWFDGHAFTSVTTPVFRAELEERLMRSTPLLPGQTAPDLDAWLNGPGLPADAPRPASDSLVPVGDAARAWAEGKMPIDRIDTKGWTTHHWLHFIGALPASLTADQMAELDKAFGLTGRGNCEIATEWLVLCVRHGYRAADARLEQHLTTLGRRKLLRPIYEELVKTEPGRETARRIYAKGRPLYQAITRRTLDSIVGWSPDA